MRAAAISLVLLLAACGARSAPPEDAADAWKDGIPGTYVLDASRNTPRTVKDAEGKEHEITEEAIASAQASQMDLRLELREDGTFTLSAEQFATDGTWRESPEGIVAKTTTVNDEPADAEFQVEETYAVERGYLISEQHGRRVYLMKLEPE